MTRKKVIEERGPNTANMQRSRGAWRETNSYVTRGTHNAKYSLSKGWLPSDYYNKLSNLSKGNLSCGSAGRVYTLSRIFDVLAGMDDVDWRYGRRGRLNNMLCPSERRWSGQWACAHGEQRGSRLSCHDSPPPACKAMNPIILTMQGFLDGTDASGRADIRGRRSMVK